MNWYLTVIKNYAGFSGRARRKEYWMFSLISFIIQLTLMAIGMSVDFPYLDSIYSLILLVPSLAVSVRRMHDVNKSGWFIIIPIYNLILLATNGDAGPNQYGPDPKAEGSFNEDALDSHLTN